MKKCVLCHMRTKRVLCHPRSLISAFVVRCLDSIISLHSIAEISRLWLACVAGQAGLCLAWSETPEDTFCRVMAQLSLSIFCFVSEFLLALFSVAICWERAVLLTFRLCCLYLIPS